MYGHKYLQSTFFLRGGVSLVEMGPLPPYSINAKLQTLCGVSKSEPGSELELTDRLTQNGLLYKGWNTAARAGLGPSSI